MSNFDEQIDEVIEGLRVSLGTDEAYWAPIESSIRVLESLKPLGRNGVLNMTDLDFRDYILSAIKPKQVELKSKHAPYADW